MTEEKSTLVCLSRMICEQNIGRRQICMQHQKIIMVFPQGGSGRITSALHRYKIGRI